MIVQKGLLILFNMLLVATYSSMSSRSPERKRRDQVRIELPMWLGRF